jgi:hypothetical protein
MARAPPQPNLAGRFLDRIQTPQHPDISKAFFCVQLGTLVVENAFGEISQLTSEVIRVFEGVLFFLFVETRRTKFGF